MTEPVKFDESRLESLIANGLIEILQDYSAYRAQQHMMSLTTAADMGVVTSLQGRIRELKDLKEMLLRVQKGKQ